MAKKSTTAKPRGKLSHTKPVGEGPRDDGDEAPARGVTGPHANYCHVTWTAHHPDGSTSSHASKADAARALRK